MLRPDQAVRMKGWSSEARQDFYDSLEHCCLTELSEAKRVAVIAARKYVLALTLHPNGKNKIPADVSPDDERIERQKKFFTPRV